MAIFSFLARLGLDTAQFEAGVKRAQSSSAALGKSIKGHLGGELRGVGASLAGLFTIGTVKQFASEIADMVGEIKDMSELLEMSTDDVQRLQKAASEAAIPFTRVVSALQRIEAEKAKALTGDEKSRSLFSMLGIDPGKAGALDILKQTIDASKRGAIENAAAFDLLGAKVGGLRRVVDELQKQGAIEIIKEEEIEKLDAATKRLEEAVRIAKIKAAPIATFATDQATQMLGWWNELSKINKAAPFLATSGPLGPLFFGTGARGFGQQQSAPQTPISAVVQPSAPLSDQDAAVELLRQMNENTRKTAEALESTVNR